MGKLPVSLNLAKAPHIDNWMASQRVGSGGEFDSFIWLCKSQSMNSTLHQKSIYLLVTTCLCEFIERICVQVHGVYQQINVKTVHRYPKVDTRPEEEFVVWPSQSSRKGRGLKSCVGLWQNFLPILLCLCRAEIPHNIFDWHCPSSLSVYWAAGHASRPQWGMQVHFYDAFSTQD